MIFCIQGCNSWCFIRVDVAQRLVQHVTGMWHSAEKIVEKDERKILHAPRTCSHAWCGLGPCWM